MWQNHKRTGYGNYSAINDRANDLALLTVDVKTVKPIPVAPSKNVKLGQTVFTVGFPNTQLQGFSPKMTKGEISSLKGILDDPRHWQISVPVQPGNSGGPLFDENGSVIGVVVAKLHSGLTMALTGNLPENVNYAVKSAYVLSLLENYATDLPKTAVTRKSEKLETVVAAVQDSVVLVQAY